MNGVDSSMRNDEKRVQCREPVSGFIHGVCGGAVSVDRERGRGPSEGHFERATACIDVDRVDMSVLDATEASEGVACMMRIDVSVMSAQP